VGCLILLALAQALPAQQILYEDGPINGETDAWTINEGFQISDTFTISTGNSTVTGLSFGAWLFPGDILESAQVTISSQEVGGGTVYFDGFVNFAQSSCFANNFGFNVCTETGAFDGPTLPNGTLWLTLQNAVVNSGDPVYWDENSGAGCHSPGCPSEAGNGTIGTLPSEAFSVLGTPTSGGGSVPEPSTLVLFAGGLAAFARGVRRKFWP
jgi:PEP-CTERM motif